jgi:uncharacterized transporter YbjL
MSMHNVQFTFRYYSIITTVDGALTNADAVEAAQELLHHEGVSTEGAQDITVEVVA